MCVSFTSGGADVKVKALRGGPESSDFTDTAGDETLVSAVTEVGVSGPVDDAVGLVAVPLAGQVCVLSGNPREGPRTVNFIWDH